LHFNIHTAVQNTDNFNFIYSFLTVENKVATSIEFPVTISNFSAILAREWICRQPVKTGIKHIQIQYPLLSTPSFLRVMANFFQIGLCHIGKCK